MDETGAQYLIWDEDARKWHEIRKQKAVIEPIPNEQDRLWLKGQALGMGHSLYRAPPAITCYSPELAWCRFKANQKRNELLDLQVEISMLEDIGCGPEELRHMVRRAEELEEAVSTYMHNAQVEVDIIGGIKSGRKKRYPEPKPKFQVHGARAIWYDRKDPPPMREQHDIDYNTSSEDYNHIDGYHMLWDGEGYED